MTTKFKQKDINKFKKLCEKLDKHILEVKKYMPNSWLFCSESGLCLMSGGREDDLISEEYIQEVYVPKCGYDSGAW